MKEPTNIRRDIIALESKRRKEQRRKQRAFRRRVITAVILVLLSVVMILGLRLRKLYMADHSFSYQMEMARENYQNASYEDAYSYVQRAIELDETSDDAWILKSDILRSMGEDEKAESALRKIIALHSDNENAYEKLVSLYEAHQDSASIAKLFASCADTEIRNKFTDYICEAPAASPDGGEFSDYQSVTLTAAENTTIYYTTDGTTPTTESAVYQEPIQLKEGTTHLKAVAINQKGIDSDILTFNYVVMYPTPDAPKVKPKSGKYVTEDNKEITIKVPDGCTAYYAFDKKPTEKTGKKYTGPVKMKEGKHTFYALVVNSYGKSSYCTSKTYKYNYEEESEDSGESDSAKTE